jgi:hypothetical protein
MIILQTAAMVRSGAVQDLGYSTPEKVLLLLAGQDATPATLSQDGCLAVSSRHGMDSSCKSQFVDIPDIVEVGVHSG